MSTWIKGEVVGHSHWADGLFSLKIAADMAPFKAGQYTSLALEIDGELHAEPYSLLSAPGSQPLEFFLYSKLEGTLSTRLANVQPGSHVKLRSKAEGSFVLTQVADAQDLWLLATGTGVAPFLSMLQTEEPWQRFRHIVLVYAVRWQKDLCYTALIDALQKQYPGQLSFIPVISRETLPDTLSGHIQAAISNGSLEEKAGRKLSQTDSQIMLCGNPGMVRATSEQLISDGFTENRGNGSGQITFESYW